MTEPSHKVLTAANELKEEKFDGVFSVLEKNQKSFDIDSRLAPLLPDLAKTIQAYAKRTGLKGQAGELAHMDLSPSLFFVGALLPEKKEMFDLLKWARKIIAAFREKKCRNVLLVLPTSHAALIPMLADALVAAEVAARFQPTFYGKDKKTKTDPHHLVCLLWAEKAHKTDVSRAAAEADALGRANNLVRELACLPANELNPSNYVVRATKMCKERGLKTRFLDKKALTEAGAGAFLAVARGSGDKNCGILIAEYTPKAAGKSHLALVGKGVTYDTGGVNVKPGTSMYGMHGDMAGSALALALILMAAEQKWSFAVKAYLAITDNAINQDAYRPNEVVIAANGLSIETIHTDAEGRMILADTLYLATKEEPKLVLDFATLTGSAIRAIGTNYGAAFTNRQELHTDIIAAGVDSGERVWPFPMDEDYGDCLDSDIADTKQCRLTGGADHIEAAMFLNKFVNKKSSWMHLDIAASEQEGGLAHIPTKEIGFGVRFAHRFIMSQLQKN